MAPTPSAARFHALESCLARVAQAPGLRSDPGLLAHIRDGERQLRELRAEVMDLARVRDAFIGVRALVGDRAPVERLQAALLEAYQRAAPHLRP